MIGLAAACAAIVIAVQLGVEHWFYLYIPWFFPLVMIALLGVRTARPAPSAARRGAARRRYPGVGGAARGRRGRTGHQDLLDCGCRARLVAEQRMRTPISHGSSSEVSKRTGICVRSDSIACSRLTPITPPRGPVMPTSVM